MAPPAVASLVAGDLILSARDLHSSYDARRHPDPVLLRALSRYQRKLAGEILRRNRRHMSTVLETAFPLADFTAGITVPDYLMPLPPLQAVYPASSVNPEPLFPVDLVSPESHTRYYRGAYLRANTLFLTGIAADWLAFVSIRFYYVAQAGTLTALTGAGGTLALPNAAEAACIAMLADFMAGRGVMDEGVEKPDRQKFAVELADAEGALYDLLGNQVQAETSAVRESF